MPKKTTADAPVTAAPAKRTPEEKAQRKADKAGRRATKSLSDDRAEKKASQKQTLKSAAKQLQKELDARMNEVVDRIRKETKAKLKEVVKEATRRLDVDTERMFEQALHTIVRHYDSIAPGRTTDINLPAPVADGASEAPGGATHGRQAPQKLNKNGGARKSRDAAASDSGSDTGKKRAGRPTGSASKPSTTGRGPGRPKRQSEPVATADVSTPEATTNDSVAVDTV
ncbi:hypothetical protein GKZ68_12760 [Hymenobacter sp. BRD128]|uniref:hypothetical protein n=1 Tax=Hymenobacter sp. BRD128 TaxID=2675878 RepID=UPI00156446CD|nr:hypothetical protein [Hymenobacter sp. BRD128]QKG57414.1 hypothetical protein GKZ68_12760 [Hymenobacter sp. BRD128]